MTRPRRDAGLDTTFLSLALHRITGVLIQRVEILPPSEPWRIPSDGVPIRIHSAPPYESSSGGTYPWKLEAFLRSTNVCSCCGGRGRARWPGVGFVRCWQCHGAGAPDVAKTVEEVLERLALAELWPWDGTEDSAPRWETAPPSFAQLVAVAGRGGAALRKVEAMVREFVRTHAFVLKWVVIPAPAFFAVYNLFEGSLLKESERKTQRALAELGVQILGVEREGERAVVRVGVIQLD